jgi:outer membrane protein TolC
MRKTSVSLIIAFTATLAFVGCSRKYYRNSADREAAKVIAQKTPQVPNMDPNFTIEQATNIVLADLPVVTVTNDFFGTEAGIELGAKVISLEESLEMAVKHSRAYQNRKEQLFLEALSLTLARHRYTPIFFAGANTTYRTQAIDVQSEIEAIIGGEIVRQQRILLEFSTDFLRFMTGDSRWVTSSRLGATFTQPLLRGAGFKVALENLTQAERNLLYELREFARFRKDFSVQIAAAYYQVLQARDEVRNAWIGLQNFRQNVERERAFVEANRTAETSLGRLQQAELSTEGQWVDAVRSYRESLDQFKILLGLPVNERVVPDERELQQLAIVHPNIAIEDSVKIALETRLDLYNERDQFEDAARRIDVAANALKPDLTLILHGDAASKPGLRPQALDFERAQWTAGLDLDLPLDRKAERNSYRGTLIGYERARRELELAVDQIKLDVNQGWRALDQARRNYDIAEVGVTLSQRRVEEQELRMEIGREGTTALDLIDSRRDLINALNQRTSALVRHTIARLEFWRDLGILYIQENGQWEEANNAAR